MIINFWFQAKLEHAKSNETIQQLNETITNRDEKILELSSLLDETTVKSKLSELSTKVADLKAQLDDSNDAKTMLEQQLESSLDQCKNLQGDLQSKVDNELHFNEKVASLERQCLEQEEVTKILREEKTVLQNTADNLKAETKG